MSLLKSTLNLLADGQFHSQEEISRFLGLPLCIIPDTLHQLLEPNVNLEKADGTGYRIPGGLELLNEKQIFNELGQAKQLLNQLEILTSIDSTNSYLLEKTKTTGKTIAVFSEQQTAGRGQFNRQWASSDLGKNIALSILYHLADKPNKLTGLSLVIGLAVVQTLEEYGLKEIKLKWPNDIIYHEKKLAGILIETRPSKPRLLSIVIGIGLNLYKPTTSSLFLKQTITDVYSIQKLPPQRNQMAALLLKNVLTTLSEFQNTNFSSFIKSWEKLDCLKDKTIHIQTTQGTFKGIARGVNAEAQLCIEVDGKLNHFNSGEIRVQLNAENC
jgi:BirA family transcriptional regulator, biotin operon repressor / biotin---[acetyl-CoA-carboxylase] ligase